MMAFIIRRMLARTYFIRSAAAASPVSMAPSINPPRFSVIPDHLFEIRRHVIRYSSKLGLCERQAAE
ncbi:MAG: hypothetical protein ACJ72Z_14175, partial [Pyrinomonadaceae bacterium]